MVAPDVGADSSRQYMMTTWMGLNIVAILFYRPGRNLGALDLRKAPHQLQTWNANAALYERRIAPSNSPLMVENAVMTKMFLTHVFLNTHQVRDVMPLAC